MNIPQIKSLHELAAELQFVRAEGKTIVYCHGCFDLLHIGHIRYLMQAKQTGDFLVVTVTPDRYVDKGPHRPAFNEQLRAEAVASLDCVDRVAINEWPTAEETLRLLRPHVYVKGSEFEDIKSDPTGKIAAEAKVAQEVGTRLTFTHDIVFSSSNLINRFLSSFPEEVNQYIDFFRERHALNDLLQVVDGMSKLSVLVIGDAILDEYQYCSVIGKSSKDPVLAAHFESQDLFAGGVIAIANHLANFAGNVQLVTILGEVDSHEDFIRSSLKENVTPRFSYKKGAPTTLKRRFIEGYSRNKLFEVYVMDDSAPNPEEDETLCSWLRTKAPEFDLVIVADFGHGAISDAMIQTLAKSSRFLAVNTQANAGNRGFNTISKYPRVDYACLAEHEIRLEMRNVRGAVRNLMEELAEKNGSKYLTVTRGNKGCVVRAEDGSYVEVPSFAQRVVDRVGAGDAFFSVTSLAAIQGVSNEILGFIGNIVGSLAVEIMGNKKSVDKVAFTRFVTSLMK